LKANTDVQILGDQWMTQVQPSFVEVIVKRIFRASPLPTAHQSGELVQGLGIKSENFSRFPCRHPPAICADIGRHRRAELAVSLVNILDRFLTLVAAGKI